MRLKNHRSPGEPKRRASCLTGQERRRWDNEVRNPMALGCSVCADLPTCGGIHKKQAGINCMEECCGKPDACTAMCPNNPVMFRDRMREINSLTFSNIPAAQKLRVIKLPGYIPHLYHGYRRNGLLEAQVVAVPLTALYDKRDGTLRLPTRVALAKQFKLHPFTRIVLLGSGRDKDIESWWRLSERRREIIAQIAGEGYELVTAPNFSLFTNQIRYDDLHSMKRIAMVNHEFLVGGVPCALHLNARTEKDYERWTTYLREHEEITHISYEFATVWRFKDRRQFHLEQLALLAHNVGRPLHLTMVGGIEAISAPAFAKVSFVDSVPFVKAMKRRLLVEGNDLKLCSHPVVTAPGMPVDDLLNKNIRVAGGRVERIFSEACAATAVTRIAQTRETHGKTASAPAAPSSAPDAVPQSSTRGRQIEIVNQR